MTNRQLKEREKKRNDHACSVYETLPIQIRSMAEWLIIMNNAPQILVKQVVVAAWEHEGENK